MGKDEARNGPISHVKEGVGPSPKDNRELL
jgi:hypothetical protein